MRKGAILIVSHLAVAGGTYALTDRRPVDTEAKHTGFFQVDKTKILSTTVESLREEGQLLVFSYKGTATVEAERTWLWLFGGHQNLVVPAVVPYYVDLSQLSLADVTYDDRAKLVRVLLPRVTVGDIAFQPEQAITTNSGTLTYSEEQVEALRRMNFLNARRGMISQAQQPGLLNSARRAAITDIQNYFEIPLRIAGMPDVKVVATFK
ncbi:DUF4230 domain-containing protein [Sphingomonas sp. CGMCC 1.13654]|uniref:DUF4230 domain-containing protein n=1 Tax=Sphingomonas chungangi TaxID=2683589 RepID=A0A838L963_9SPHN|nr:DUF4230 domain-containing protein [Sphingomonas chungangi]MBA2935312.1 DUF4230 domain-containing protein [Sphingomonas chungangi]MVW56819.1 DUF4230 domain-containing protein [Sphingomonas chungangi]